MLFSEEKLFVILSLRDVEYESNRGSGPTEPRCCFFGLHFNGLIFPKGTHVHSGKTWQMLQFKCSIPVLHFTTLLMHSTAETVKTTSWISEMFWNIDALVACWGAIWWMSSLLLPPYAHEILRRLCWRLQDGLVKAHCSVCRIVVFSVSSSIKVHTEKTI